MTVVIEYPQPEEGTTGQGVRQTQKMRPPAPREGMLNQEMAEAAAIQFKKREKSIQKACAALDNPEVADEPKNEPKNSCCIIL